MQTLESISDNAIMLKVKSGDFNKLGILFERYNRMLFGFFYRITSNREVSEDLVQNLVKYGITSISVNPDAINRVRGVIKEAEKDR